MPLATVKYVDPTPLYDAEGRLLPHWSKVEGPFQSFKLLDREVSIENIAGRESEFDIDTFGFTVHHWPLAGNDIFASDGSIRQQYYPQVESLLRAKLGNVNRVVIFDHTLRQMSPDAARKPVMQVHVDQTARAAEARVRRHLPASEAETLLRSRYSLINVWRPVGNAAIEYPLAAVDWRTLAPQDFVLVDLLYPLRDRQQTNDGDDGDDDRGFEVVPPKHSLASTDGYEVRGETYGIAPSDRHRFYYVKNMTPDSTMLIKCADSKGPGLPTAGDGAANPVASCCPHTAFTDPETPSDAPRRRSIEVRCLVFFDEPLECS